MQEKLDQWINWVEYDELLAGCHNAPHNILGLHNFGKGQVFTVYRPEAKQIFVTNAKGEQKVELEEVGEGSGFFGLYVDGKKYKSDYLLHIYYGENDVVVTADPYAFEPQISSDDLYLFAEGKHYQIYDKLGAHPMTINGVKGTYFAVWAPHARAVSVVGNFNMWDGRLHLMRTLEVSGVYEIFIPGVEPGAVYKYQILTRKGDLLMKSDPYANCAELRPNNASVVADIEGYHWKDNKWMNARVKETRQSLRKKPMAIYEMHLGSWKKKDDGTEDGFYNYRELAPMVADYVLKMGYTHVELMGIAEHPFDGSWGYQVTGYYAPTRRYGDPKDFMYFVDYMHEKGIYVILDWVPAHFPKDAHGLAEFDGSCLYEYADPRKGEHPDWGTKIFDYGKNEVKNFLIGSALLWVEHYHVDGLRVDAVASMLYLDYGKEAGQWVPNQYGDNKNLEAIEFFKHINTLVLGRNPGAVMIAEESTAWPKVTGPVEDDGLNFSYKWNMGWMHDFLDYMKLDPYFRRDNHHKMTFAMSYNESEKYILVLSHDEVVHLKCSMINKMPGLGIDKFRNLMAGYAFMMGHPGKKLLFMGQEFAQLREWSEERELDWFLLDNPDHKHIQNWVKKLLHIYRKNPALYELDSSWGGFEWINANDADRSIYSFIRKSKDGKNQLLFVCSFTPVARPDYRVGVPAKKTYKLILDSDSEEFGGCGRQRPQSYKAVEAECDGRPYSIAYPLEPYGVAVFRY